MEMPIESYYTNPDAKVLDTFMVARNEQSQFFGTFSTEVLRSAATKKSSDADAARVIFSQFDDSKVTPTHD